MEFRKTTSFQSTDDASKSFIKISLKMEGNLTRLLDVNSGKELLANLLVQVNNWVSSTLLEWYKNQVGGDDA
jgi:hypothetical protein